MEDIDSIISEAKAKRKQAETLAAVQDLEAEGLLQDKSDRPSAFEVAARNISEAQHNPKTAEVAEGHSNIPKNVLSASYEMGVIAKAARKEQQMFTKFKTIDDVTQKENEIFVDIMREGNEILHRQLPALEGRSRDDANQNLNSVVAGESSRLAAMNPMIDTPLGAWGKLKKWVGGSK